MSTMTAVQLGFKQLRQIKDIIEGLIVGDDLKRPHVIAIDLQDCELADQIFEGCLYESPMENCARGYVEMTADNVGDLMRFFCKMDDQFICINLQDLEDNSWKYLNAKTHSLTETLPGLVLRENYDGYLLTYGVNENRWNNMMAKIQIRHKGILQQWSMFLIDKTAIYKEKVCIGMYLGSGIEVRFDNPDYFAIVVNGREGEIYFHDSDEFFDYIGREVLKIEL